MFALWWYALASLSIVAPLIFLHTLEPTGLVMKTWTIGQEYATKTVGGHA